jgi:hypothetical protein
VDSERAERHLRLAAEAELRRVLGQYGQDREASLRGPAAMEALDRLGRIAGALIVVGAIDGEQAETVTGVLETALGVRGLDPPGLRLHPGHARRLRLQALARRSASVTVATAVLAGGRATDGQPAIRVIPVERMLPFLGEDARGEVYFLSLVVTPDRATLPAIVHARASPSGPVATAARAHILPFQLMTAVDDAGNDYHLIFSGRGAGRADVWEGHFDIHPAPHGARWLQLALSSGEPALRIDLTRCPGPAEVTAEPTLAAPGERLLEAVAQGILLATVIDRALLTRLAGSLGDIVAALEAAGALSAFSPSPARLAALCQRLDIGSRGVTVPPATDLPEPWTDVLAHYGRRHQRPGREGTAALAVLLPELDGARFALAGLHSRDDQTTLYVVARGVPPTHPQFRIAPANYIGSSWWIRDNAGHWHIAAAHEWTDDGSGEHSFGLRVYPPLGRAVTSLDLVITGPSAQVRAHLPVSWWAAP